MILGDSPQLVYRAPVFASLNLKSNFVEDKMSILYVYLRKCI